MKSCERAAVNFPIQSAGADIMKISLVTLHKEFYKRGWLKNGDDSIRMLLTVHDEIVFEIKHARVTEAIPIIVKIMAAPANMLRWEIPLIVEPLIGPDWGTGYKCEEYKAGHNLEEGDVLVNGFVYGTIRSVDLGKDTPGPLEEEYKRDEAKKKVKIRILNASWLQGISSTPESLPQGSSSAETVRTTLAPQPAAPKAAPKEIPLTKAKPEVPPPQATKADLPELGVVTLKIGNLREHTVDQVLGAYLRCLEPNGKILRIVDATGTILIDKADRMVANPEKMAKILLEEYNLGDGEVYTN